MQAAAYLSLRRAGVHALCSAIRARVRTSLEVVLCGGPTTNINLHGLRLQGSLKRRNLG
jgi:hypothetical protein